MQDRLVERFRARVEANPERIEIDFPKSKGGRAAKTEVMEDLDRSVPRWQRVFAIYPNESSLRRKRQ